MEENRTQTANFSGCQFVISHGITPWNIIVFEFNPDANAQPSEFQREARRAVLGRIFYQRHEYGDFDYQNLVLEFSGLQGFSAQTIEFLISRGVRVFWLRWNYDANRLDVVRDTLRTYGVSHEQPTV